MPVTPDGLPSGLAVSLDQSLRYAVIGPVVWLRQSYDPAQLWLPFVCAVICRPPPPRPVRSTRVPTSLLRHLHQQVYVVADRSDPTTTRYGHTTGVAQCELPFIEFRMVSDDEWAVLSEAGYPAWETRNGLPLVLSVGNRHYEDVRDWLLDNCRGRFRYNKHLSRNIVFERLSDFAMARLRYS